MGRPRHQQTPENRKLAETVAGLGLPHEQIGALLGIDDKTLRKHYRLELDQGIAKANSNVVKSLYSKAVDGDVTACIWWTKTRLGWKDTSRIDQIVTFKRDINDMSKEEILDRLTIIGRAIATASVLDSDGSEREPAQFCQLP